MLTHHRKPVCLSLVSTDLPLWSMVETSATLYQKDRDRFHLLLTEPPIRDWEPLLPEPSDGENPHEPIPPTPRLLWLEMSPYRVIMTMQGNGKLSYRHLWERGIYGISRYWLNGETAHNYDQVRLRNYTLDLQVAYTRQENFQLPTQMRLEYELWADKVQLGRYVLQLNIGH